MKRLILFLIVFALCLFCGCTTSNNEEKQQNSISESISEVESSLSSASIYESSVSSEPGSAVQSESSSAPPQSSASSTPPSSASSSANPPASSSSSSKPSQKNIKAPNDYYVSLDYYLDSGFYGNRENAGLLSGATVDSEHIVPAYSLKPRYDLMREPSEVEAFLEDYDGGKALSDMCEQGESYYCVLSDGSEAVLRLKNGVLKVSVVSGGSGSGFLFPAAVSGYDGNAVSAKNLAITRLLRGILVSDGNAESFIVLEAYEPFSAEFKQNTLYPISDIVEFIRKNKDYGF
ncbi:MAG: hypothetical protein MR987_02690 [Oscillospiraceae bacterium]|nr:hypothetical protein [Oscillospiraceae bacterium]